MNVTLWMESNNSFAHPAVRAQYLWAMELCRSQNTPSRWVTGSWQGNWAISCSVRGGRSNLIRTEVVVGTVGAAVALQAAVPKVVPGLQL